VTCVIFEGAIFVRIEVDKERSCHCPCVAAGHRTCHGHIPAGQPFQLALIERPVATLRPLGAARTCYRDQFRLCESCAAAVKARRRDGRP
jgi:hypothetical protein